MKFKIKYAFYHLYIGASYAVVLYGMTCFTWYGMKNWFAFATANGTQISDEMQLIPC